MSALSINLGPLTDVANKAADSFNKLPTEYQYAVGIAGGISSLYLLKNIFFARSSKKEKPTTFDLSGGAIADAEVMKEFKAYSNSYGKDPGTGIVDKSKTVHLVDIFYSLVTDLYEWGWGQSFHFSPKLPGRSWKESEIAHETRIAAILQTTNGKNLIDLGCGVGGPMRTIAAVSGIHVTGVTINQYQVDRARLHNFRKGMAGLTDVIRSDFLRIPFPENHFDGAYAIEATCHAPRLQEVYAEAYRVIKPGSLFVSYEWVTTAKFDAKNLKHVKIVDDINYGNGLPDMRTWKEAEEAGKEVGFELVTSIDLAVQSNVCGAWYDRLRVFRFSHHFNQFIVDCFDLVGLAPKGLKHVHAMLVMTAGALIEGGQTGIFTPMQMLVFRKPVTKA